MGNRTSRVTDTGGGPITESYSIATGSNRLQSVATSGVTGRAFSYDASGNLTQDQDVFYSQTKVFGWNHPGQIASVTRNGVPYGSYLYDYLHRMVVRSVPSGAGTMHRVHDLDGNVIAEYHSSGYLMTEYVWLEDRPIAVIADAGGTPRTLWVHTDHLERPILMTDANGSVVWQASPALRYGSGRSPLEKPVLGLFARCADRVSPVRRGALDHRHGDAGLPLPRPVVPDGGWPRLQLAPPLRRHDGPLCLARSARHAGRAEQVCVCRQQPADVRGSGGDESVCWTDDA